MRCAVLRKIRDRFKGEIRIGDQFTKSYQRSPVRCHTSTVRRDGSESNRSLFSFNAHFRWDEKAGPSAGCDTLPMRNALNVQSKGDRP